MTGFCHWHRALRAHDGAAHVCSFPFSYWVESHHVDVPPWVCPFISWWTFTSKFYNPRNGSTMSYGNSTFSILRISFFLTWDKTNIIARDSITVYGINWRLAFPWFLSSIFVDGSIRQIFPRCASLCPIYLKPGLSCRLKTIVWFPHKGWVVWDISCHFLYVCSLFIKWSSHDIPPHMLCHPPLK